MTSRTRLVLLTALDWSAELEVRREERTDAARIDKLDGRRNERMLNERKERVQARGSKGTRKEDALMLLLVSGNAVLRLCQKGNWPLRLPRVNQAQLLETSTAVQRGPERSRAVHRLYQREPQHMPRSTQPQVATHNSAIMYTCVTLVNLTPKQGPLARQSHRP